MACLSLIDGCAGGGQVDGEAATPMAEAGAHLHVELMCDGESIATARTGADGRFHLEDVPTDERCSVTVSGPGYLPAAQSVEFSATRRKARVRVSVMPLGQVNGLVRGALTKEPVAGCTVHTGKGRTTTDADGGWSLTDLEPGSHRVSVDCNGATASETVVVPPGQKVVRAATTHVLRFEGGTAVWVPDGPSAASPVGSPLNLPPQFRSTLRHGSKITRSFEPRSVLSDAMVASARRRLKPIAPGSRLAVLAQRGGQQLAIPLLWHDRKEVPCDWSNLKATIPTGWYLGFVKADVSFSQIGTSTIRSSRRTLRIHSLGGEQLTIGDRSLRVVTADWPAGTYCLITVPGSEQEIKGGETCHLVEVGGGQSAAGSDEGRARR